MSSSHKRRARKSRNKVINGFAFGLFGIGAIALVIHLVRGAQQVASKGDV